MPSAKAVVPPLGTGRGEDAVEQGHQVVLAPAGGDGHGAVGGEQHGAEAVAGAGGEEPGGGRGRDGQVALLAQRGAEVEATGTGRASSHVSSSRSAIVSRTWGCWSRAVTFQSMRRTSSPGWYSRVSPSSEPWPGTRPRYSPWSRPSRRRLISRSRRRRTCSGLPDVDIGVVGGGRDTVGSGAAVVRAIVGRRSREAQVLSRRRRECRGRRRRGRRGRRRGGGERRAGSCRPG